MFCFSNDDPRETCLLTFILFTYLFIYIIIVWGDKLSKKQFAGVLLNAQQKKNIHAKEVYLTLHNNCIFPNEPSEAIWLSDKFIV